MLKLLLTLIHTKAVWMEVRRERIGGPTSFHLVFHLRDSARRDSWRRACDSIIRGDIQRIPIIKLLSPLGWWVPGACQQRPLRQRSRTGEDATVFKGVESSWF
jgi:hypothetical protein